MRRWLGAGAGFKRQGSGDLGERMERAFQAAFHEGCGKVLLFGSDIPQLSSKALVQAMTHLQEKDVVLGPSRDGGYWLIGLRRRAGLFSGIRWGTQEVLGETLAKAEGLGLSRALMEPLSDIDTPEDLQRLLPAWSGLKPYLSVIVPALNEGPFIEKTLRRALFPDGEVIVVDGGSQDRTLEKAAEAGARVLKGSKGRGCQQNLGVRAARGHAILFLHADTVLPENYGELVFETLLDRKVVLGAFRFRTDLKGSLARMLEGLVNFRSRCLRLPYGDQAFFLRKAAFQEAGGFPEVPIGEDYFLVRALKEKGRIALADAHVTTSGRRWAKEGLLRTTWINQVVLAGFAMGIPLSTLAAIYGRQRSKRRHEGKCI